MKTIYKRVRVKDGTKTYRVPEKRAVILIKSGEYVYATRAEWKADGRNMDGP